MVSHGRVQFTPVSKYYVSSLYEKLRDEGLLVPDDLDAVLLSTFPPNPRYRRHNRPLYTIKRHIYRPFRWLFAEIIGRYRARHGEATILSPIH